MDLVCITDHDSIDGGLELLSQRPDAADVIVGEEITCWLPEGKVEVHIAAYGMTEALHRDVQHLRGNVFDVTARLRQAGVFFALNHLLHFYRHQLPLERYLELMHEVPALEVRNGTMLPAHNALCERLIAEAQGLLQPLGMIGGSDAHTLRRVGTTWTETPGATREQFIDSLKRGLGQPGGVHGGTAPVAGDAYGVVARYVAALAGFGPQDVRSWRRAACLAFAAVTLPFQITPLLVAAARKSAERRTVRDVEAALASGRSSLKPRVSTPESLSRLSSPEPRVPTPASCLSSPEPRVPTPASCLSSPEPRVPSPECNLPIGASS
jgi:predicted metal-dependent phosphoesterase TrpH